MIAGLRTAHALSAEDLARITVARRRALPGLRRSIVGGFVGGVLAGALATCAVRTTTELAWFDRAQPPAKTTPTAPPSAPARAVPPPEPPAPVRAALHDEPVMRRAPAPEPRPRPPWTALAVGGAVGFVLTFGACRLLRIR